MSNVPRVLVTRTINQAEIFSHKLLAAGFVPVEFPTIQLIPLSWQPLDAALAVLGNFDWLIFTSSNAADFFLQRFTALKLSADSLPPIAAIGTATAARLAAHRIPVAFVPDEFTGTALLPGMGDLVGKKVLLPRTKIGRSDLPDLLKAQGAKVVEVWLYDTITAVPAPESLMTFSESFAAITFTSPSSIHNFLKIMTAHAHQLPMPIEAILQAAQIVCIGPVTADAARAAGLPNVLIPAEYTIDGMVQLLTAVLRPHKVTHDV